MSSAHRPDLNDAQRTLVDSYRLIAYTLEHYRDELAPFEERNAEKALGVMWQLKNG